MFYPALEYWQLACLPVEYRCFRYMIMSYYVMIMYNMFSSLLIQCMLVFEIAFSSALTHVMYVSDDTYWVYFYILTTLIFMISRQGHNN